MHGVPQYRSVSQPAHHDVTSVGQDRVQIVQNLDHVALVVGWIGHMIEGVVVAVCYCSLIFIQAL